MEKQKRNSNLQQAKKNVRSQKRSGKKNPRSKRIPNLIDNKTFAQDNLNRTDVTQITFSKGGGIKQNFELTPLQKVKDQSDKTQKKPLLNPMTQPNPGNTVNRNKKLKSVGPKSKRSEYIYIVDPQSQKMKKYVVHQGQDVDLLLNNNVEYVPPFMVFFCLKKSCDEDCDSTEEIVQKGVEYSKKDLINEIQRRKKSMEFRKLIRRDSQNSSSTDSLSPKK